MENVRYNISPCTSEEATVFVGKIDTTVYERRAAVMADERSHYDRYSFVRNDCKIAIVFDNLANVISITAPERYADELLHVFGTDGRSVKRSTVPAQGKSKQRRTGDVSIPVDGATPDTRARIFVNTETLRQKAEPNRRVRVTPYSQPLQSQGFESSTDENFTQNPNITFGVSNKQTRRNANVYTPSSYGFGKATDKNTQRSAVGEKRVEPSIVPPVKRNSRTPRKAVISFGDDEDYGNSSKPAILPRSGTGLYAAISAPRIVENENQTERDSVVPEKKKRGRPRKNPLPNSDAHDTVPFESSSRPVFDRPKTQTVQPEYKNGFSVKNFPDEKLTALIKRLKADGYSVTVSAKEFPGTSQEVIEYSVEDSTGAKVYIRYATKKMTVQLQGRRSELFGEVQVQIGRDSDYSSALEGYIESSSTAVKTKPSDVDNKLKKRLPTAYGFLSEQSRLDFSYGMHDFSRNSLQLSDYSVLLVPPFRGLERFIFDLQKAEGIKVKMIGQAYDKDDSGNYVLKNGYRQRIGSVVYSEVMVALYTEYFMRRNFFSHSDNSEDNRSRAITDRNMAKSIFDNLLDVVEYNAKKLKEIGFSLDNSQNSD